MWNIWWKLGLRLFDLPGKRQKFRGEFRDKFQQNFRRLRFKFHVFFRKLCSAGRAVLTNWRFKGKQRTFGPFWGLSFLGFYIKKRDSLKGSRKVFQQSLGKELKLEQLFKFESCCWTSRDLWLKLNICGAHAHVHAHIYIHIYMYREREHHICRSPFFRWKTSVWIGPCKMCLPSLSLCAFAIMALRAPQQANPFPCFCVVYVLFWFVLLFWIVLLLWFVLLSWLVFCWFVFVWCLVLKRMRKNQPNKDKETNKTKPCFSVLFGTLGGRMFQNKTAKQNQNKKTFPQNPSFFWGGGSFLFLFPFLYLFLSCFLFSLFFLLLPQRERDRQKAK